MTADFAAFNPPCPTASSFPVNTATRTPVRSKASQMRLSIGRSSGVQEFKEFKERGQEPESGR
jgi:hypothetical protein